MNFLDMLLKVPLVFSFQVTIRAMIDNIVMFGFNVLLDISNLCIFIITELTLVLDSLMLTIDVSFQGALINGDKITKLAMESHSSMDRLNVPE